MIFKSKRRGKAGLKVTFQKNNLKGVVPTRGRKWYKTMKSYPEDQSIFMDKCHKKREEEE